MKNYSSHSVNEAALTTKLERIEMSQPIRADEGDYDFANSPEVLSDEFGALFHYLGRVENEAIFVTNSLTSYLTARS